MTNVYLENVEIQNRPSVLGTSCISISNLTMFATTKLEHQDTYFNVYFLHMKRIYKREIIVCALHIYSVLCVFCRVLMVRV